MEIKNNIRLLRAQFHLTQEDLAREVSVTRQTIIAMEKGNYVPSLELAFRLSMVFGKSIEEIFTYKK